MSRRAVVSSVVGGLVALLVGYGLAQMLDAPSGGAVEPIDLQGPADDIIPSSPATGPRVVPPPTLAPSSTIIPPAPVPAPPRPASPAPPPPPSRPPAPPPAPAGDDLDDIDDIDDADDSDGDG